MKKEIKFFAEKESILNVKSTFSLFEDTHSSDANLLTKECIY